MANLYADVIIEISHEKLDRPFQYRIPDNLRESIAPGARVLIPFGNGDRTIKGYVVSVSDTPAIEEHRIKSIIEQVIPDYAHEPEAQLVALAVWMKHHYGGTLIQSLKVVLPVRATIKQKEKKTIRLTVGEDELLSIIDQCIKKHQKARARLLEALLECPEIDYSLAASRLNITMATLKPLAEKNIIAIDSEVSYRNPKMLSEADGNKKNLTEAQQKIVNSFIADYDMGFTQPCLIHGVTGSGKTEVYMELMEHVIKKGRQAIMLIPEIALTFQTVMRLSKRFGSRVSYLHSKLSAGEKYDQFERAAKGEIDIMIGPRSALFTPFARLGLIIIDEEHETSYKAENMPKYHARETAIERASLAGATVVMGSATPSIDSYFAAKRGEFRLYELKERISSNGLPTVHVVDLREELRRGNLTIFSDKLRSLMEDRLSKHEQIMLFLNRRGMAGFVSCRKCGHVCKCPHCEVSLSLHRNGSLVCHYCGYEEKFTHICPECGSKYIGTMKAGTEQIEEAVRKTFPNARVLRMDADTTKKKDDYQKILSTFADGEADILIGTQMIVKGHDFANVTLVGILAADLSLHINDYRSAERTFALLTQAAGRAGRADRPGEVVIQTYSPEHYGVATSAAQDYNKFYEEEIGYRRLGGYPPISHMLKILVEDADAREGKTVATYMAKLAEYYKPKSTIGPAPDSISKIKDVYSYVIYIKDDDYEKLVDIKDKMEQWRQVNNVGRSTVLFDFDA